MFFPWQELICAFFPEFAFGIKCLSRSFVHSWLLNYLCSVLFKYEKINLVHYSMALKKTFWSGMPSAALLKCTKWNKKEGLFISFCTKKPSRFCQFKPWFKGWIKKWIQRVFDFLVILESRRDLHTELSSSLWRNLCAATLILTGLKLTLPNVEGSQAENGHQPRISRPFD